MPCILPDGCGCPSQQWGLSELEQWGQQLPHHHHSRQQAELTSRLPPLTLETGLRQRLDKSTIWHQYSYGCPAAREKKCYLPLPD